MRRIGLTVFWVLAVLACVFVLVAQVNDQGQDGQGQDDQIVKTLTFTMPACPIKQITIPPTKTEFTLPKKNPLGDSFSVAGTIQVADQTGGVILKTSTVAAFDLTQLGFARTVNTIQHLTGSLTFDHGCVSTDPYGSNHCTWAWGDPVTAAYQGALQEDITSGKLVVDLKINNTIPLSFSCPVCGASCSFAVPQQLDKGRWNDLWPLMIRLLRFSLRTVAPTH